VKKCFSHKFSCKRKTSLLFLPLLFCVTISFAQNRYSHGPPYKRSNGSSEYGRYWAGMSLNLIPLSNHVLAGLNFELEYYYTNRFAIGAGLSVNAGKLSNSYGLNYVHPYFQCGNIVLINRFKIFDGGDFQTSLFLKSGFEPVEISDNTKSAWVAAITNTRINSSIFKATNYFVFQPGIGTAFRFFGSNCLFSTELSYRFLYGKSNFGTTSSFQGLELSIGFYLDE